MGVNYALLSDRSAATVKAYGILNPDYAPGHRAHGVPLPGIVYIGTDGRIVLKRAVANYRERPPFEEILEAVAAAR